MYTKHIVPGRAPKQFTEPSHDSSSFVNGPDFSGVSFDEKISKAGDTKPMNVPYPRITTLAVWNQLILFAYDEGIDLHIHNFIIVENLSENIQKLFYLWNYTCNCTNVLISNRC